MNCRPVGRFDAQQRVRRRADFQRIQRGGLKVVSRRFVFLMTHGSHNRPRLGITASRRVGNAVTRNRAKRLVREAFRSTRDLWAPGLELVVIVRRSLDDTTLAEVVSEWRGVERQLRSRQSKWAPGRAAQAGSC